MGSVFSAKVDKQMARASGLTSISRPHSGPLVLAPGTPEGNRTPKITQAGPETSCDRSTFKSVTIQPLNQGLALLSHKRPSGKYFRLCGLHGPEPTSCVYRICHWVNCGERGPPPTKTRYPLPPSPWQPGRAQLA